MTGTPIRTGISLLLMLATSACASGQVVAGAADERPQVDSGAALPGLPAAVGSWVDGARLGPLPAAARQLLQALGCTAALQGDALVVQWPGSGGGQDMLVTDREGPHYRYWLRAFGTGDMRTGYLVQLNGCPATSHGMRAYIATGSGGLEEVTAQLLAQATGPDAAEMDRLQDAGASELFALQAVRPEVPVLRWIAEPDPDRPLPRTSHTFANGALVHGGFLLWKDGRFQRLQRVGRDSWPCADDAVDACRDDPFVDR